MNQERTNKQERVLFIITKGTWGGAQRYVFDLATNLSKECFETDVAFGDRGRLSMMLEEKGYKTHHLPALGRDIALVADITGFFQICALFQKIKPDIVHLNSSKAAALGALAARLFGVPKIIFTAHGWPFKEDRNAMARAIIYFISWVTALLSHRTIVVSKQDETAGKRMPFVGNKIHYITLGIAPPEFLSRAAASASLAISTTHPRIVTICELTKNKGLHYAIEAVAELKRRDVRVEYFIIGEGELRSELEAHMREHSVADRVRFLGFVDTAARFLKAFDVFLLPSIKEGTPYVLLEAAHASLPIIATSAVDISMNNMATIVPVGKPSLLAEALEHALQEIPARGPMPVPSVDDMMKETLRIYTNRNESSSDETDSGCPT